MAKIQLTQNKVALVDEDTLDLLTPYKWTYVEFVPETSKSPQIYVCRGERKGGTYKRFYLHRVMADLLFGKKAKGKRVIFNNGDRLDFRKKNISLKGG